MILETVRQAQERTLQQWRRFSLSWVCPKQLAIAGKSREREGQLEDRIVVPHQSACPPTPEEEAAVRQYALEHPQIGYKRLTWQMVDANVAYLRPYQVYRVLRAGNLLCRQRKPVIESRRRPPAPSRADQVWHIDLMYLYIAPRWYYLVDILDGYSRFLVHWSLNLTMLTGTVTLTVQQALDQLSERRSGEPRIVHDNGGQFISLEWRRFVEGAGLTDIKTRAAHPQSNGVLERLHCTHREEGLAGEALEAHYQALGVMAGWSDYYN